MASVDVCNLTWDLVEDDRIVYERIKFPKTAKPILITKAKMIMNKYVRGMLWELCFSGLYT